VIHLYTVAIGSAKISTIIKFSAIIIKYALGPDAIRTATKNKKITEIKNFDRIHRIYRIENKTKKQASWSCS